MKERSIDEVPVWPGCLIRDPHRGSINIGIVKLIECEAKGYMVRLREREANGCIDFMIFKTKEAWEMFKKRKPKPVLIDKKFGIRVKVLFGARFDENFIYEGEKVFDLKHQIVEPEDLWREYRDLIIGLRELLGLSPYR